MRYDERIASVLYFLRAAKHGLSVRYLLERLKIIYPDNYASAYRMIRRDIRQFNAEIGRALGCSICVANRPAQCRLEWEGLEQPLIRLAD